MTARYFMLINRFTGVQVIIDTWARRLSRMRARVFIWADLVKEFYPEAECKIAAITKQSHPEQRASNTEKNKPAV